MHSPSPRNEPTADADGVTSPGGGSTASPPSAANPTQPALADYNDRFSARVLDWIALVGPAALSVMVLDMMLRRAGYAPQLALVGVGLTVPVCILQWYLIATCGQTLGKRAMGTRIVRTDGSPAGFLRGVVMREWCAFGVSLIPFIGAAFPLIDATWIFKSNKKQTLHDLLADTLVMKLPSSPSLLP